MTFQLWWLERHEQRIREMERARFERRIWALLNTGGRDSKDFEGCVE